MKFLLLLYLVYYLIEDSNSFKDDDSRYPRVYYLKRQGAPSAFKQKSQLQEVDEHPKQKRAVEKSTLDGLQYKNKRLSNPISNTNKLPSQKLEVKKGTKVTRNQKKPNDKTKNNKRISSSKQSDKAKRNKQMISSKKQLRTENNWNKIVLKSYLDTYENEDGDDYMSEYTGNKKLSAQAVDGNKYEDENASGDDSQTNEMETADDGPGNNDKNEGEYDTYDNVNVEGNKKSRNENEQSLPENYKFEIEAGELADMVQNNRHFVPMKYAYHDLGRRFVLQYPYHEVHNIDTDVENTAEYQLDEAIKEAMQRGIEDERLKPVKANPGLVLSIAKESALLEASKPVNPSREVIQNSLLRTGDYWNSYWKENVPNPEEVSLRSEKHLLRPKLETVRVKIMPGSRLYQLVSITKKVSPRLLYIINSNKDAL